MSDLVSCACGDQYPADSYGAGWIAAVGECPNCAVAGETGPWMTKKQAAKDLASMACNIDCLSSVRCGLPDADIDAVKALVGVIYVAAEKIGGDQ